jgi:hypothetical protein
MPNYELSSPNSLELADPFLALLLSFEILVTHPIALAVMSPATNAFSYLSQLS